MTNDLLTKPQDDATDQPPAARAADLDSRLASLHDEVHAQSRRISAFNIFSVLAFVLALCTLMAVAFRVQSDNGNSTPAAGMMSGRSAATTPAPATAAAPATPAAPASATPPHRVDVGLREFAVLPSSSIAAAGRVTFAVKNTGTITHELVVLKTSKRADALLDGARASEAGNVGETGDLAAGASKTFSVKLKAGHYALICNLPGHYSAGQRVDFTIR